jgi:hypothetical protein
MSKHNSNSKGNNEEKIELYLPKFETEETAKGIDEVWERFPESIDKITDWFKNSQWTRLNYLLVA